MITKGIVQEIVDLYTIKVRMPTLDGMDYSSENTPDKYLSSAIICLPPQCKYSLEVGDIVIVGFEDDDLGKPIILGCLFRESNNISSLDMNVNSLSSLNTILGEYTYIGEVQPKEIKSLIGVEGSIQSQIDHLEDLIYYLEDRVNSLENRG